MKNDIEYNAETNNEFSTRPVQLRSVDSKFAYNLHFMTNTMHICYEENMLSPNLVKQFETLNLPEEGFVVTEYKLK
jgi:hypothetical protein